MVKLLYLIVNYHEMTEFISDEEKNNLVSDFLVEEASLFTYHFFKGPGGELEMRRSLSL